MNNATIILMESVKLMEEGKLKGSGEYIEIETEEGKKEIELPEKIHTYVKWKELGYQVKKGAKSEIKIPVWKYYGNVKHDEESGQDIEKGKCFLKNAAFFTSAQVEKIVTA